MFILSEATPIKPQQHDCINMTWTKITTANRLMWMGKANKAFTLYKNNMPLRNAENRSSSLPQGRERTINLLSNIKWSEGKAYM